MVIQISPHTEPAASQPPQGVESPQKLKPEKNGIGVFAKILAGLTIKGAPHKTGTGELATGVAIDAEVPDSVPLAEASETDGLQPVLKTGKKAAKAGKIAVTEKNGAIKSPKSGKTQPENTEIELSELEKSALFGVERLTTQLEGQKIPEKEGDVLDSEALAADSPHFTGETASTGLIVNEQILNTGEPEKRPLVAGIAAEEAGETAKSRVKPVEIRTQEGAAPAQDSLHRPDEKKAGLNEKDGRSKADEIRGKDKRKSASIEVHDFRSAEAGQKEGPVHVKAAVDSRLSGEGTNRDITLELRLPNQGQDNSSATTTWEAKAGQSFEDLLARELHQNFNNDIVRHASIALRDGNEGTIRLALKPESLGNVKIQLEMAENKITGRIVVESEEALRAFEREIASLEKAFRDSGFEGANLEMSLAADGGAQQQWQGTEASQFLSGQIAASRYDAAIERIEIPLTPDFYRQEAWAVNVLA